MKVFVTGASGFIGSHTVAALLKAGHQVMALVRPNSSSRRLAHLSSQINIISGSLANVPSYRNILSDWAPEACIHLAWYAEPGKYLSSQENIRSLNDGLSLLKVLAESHCKQIVCAGTCFEYEATPSFLTETDKIKPETLYAASKLSFLMLGEQIAKQSDLKFTWGRIFHLYGSHEDARRLVPAAILTLKENKTFSASPGEQKRDYLHVSDVANAFVTLVEKQAAGVYNICSAQPVTIKRLLEMIGEIMGKPELLALGALPYREWEPMFLCGNNDKLKSLGWMPQIELHSGLHETVEWWNKTS